MQRVLCIGVLERGASEGDKRAKVFARALERVAVRTRDQLDRKVRGGIDAERADLVGGQLARSERNHLWNAIRVVVRQLEVDALEAELARDVVRADREKLGRAGDIDHDPVATVCAAKDADEFAHGDARLLKRIVATRLAVLEQRASMDGANHAGRATRGIGRVRHVHMTDCHGADGERRGDRGERLPADSLDETCARVRHARTIPRCASLRIRIANPHICVAARAWWRRDSEDLDGAVVEGAVNALRRPHHDLLAARHSADHGQRLRIRANIAAFDAGEHADALARGRDGGWRGRGARHCVCNAGDEGGEGDEQTDAASSDD